MFKCGFYEKDITPALGSNIPGYAARCEAEDILLPLYSKAIAIESNGKCVIIISIDAICMSNFIHDEAVKRISEYTGVPSECILIHATHTHTGGPIEAVKLKYPNPYFTGDEEYTKMLAKAVGDSGILAYKRLEPMKASYAKGNVEGLGFNRNYQMKDGSIRTNPGYKSPDIIKAIGKTDSDFPVILFYDEKGKEKGMLWNFTLHHDTTSSYETDRAICSDYSGALARLMKKKFGNDFISVFVNGACGNINHLDVTQEPSVFYKEPFCFKVGEKLALELEELIPRMKPFEIDVVDGCKEKLELKRRVLSEETIKEYEELYNTISLDGLKSDIAKPDSKEYKRSRAETFLNFAELPKTENMFIQALRIGDCMIYALPGEVYAEFGLLAKELSPLSFNMVAELANNGVRGSYVPTPETFGTEIYEAQITSAEFTEDAGEKMARFAVELGKKLVD